MATKKNCVFCQIGKDDQPAFKIYEDDKCTVILDRFPGTKGQCLVITKDHVDYIMDLPDATYTHIFKVAKKVAKAIDAALNTIRTCVVVEGFMISHVHIRLHPAYEKELAMYGKEAQEDDLKEIAEKIKAHL